MMSGIALTSYAATVKYTKNCDFTKGLLVTNQSGNVSFSYTPGNGSTTYARTRSGVKLNANSYGYVASTTTAGTTSIHKYWGGKSTVAGWYYNPTAVATYKKYATSVYFYADFRASSNNITTIYELTGY